MARLAYFALFTAILAYAAGCTRTSLTYVGDGGTECTGLSPNECAADSRCEQHIGCCNDFECVPKGTLFAPCPLAPASACTQQCSGLDAQTCSATPGCRADYCSECSCTPVFVGCTRTVDPPTTCPLVECPAFHCQCDGLDEQSCIANESSLGCTANYCAGCNGTSLFSGCTGPGQGPPACPERLCPNGCRTQSDCANGAGGECLAPGQPLCGGACPMSCTSDTQCGAGNVCAFSPCSCSASNSNICQASCATAGCPDGQSCGSDGHCSATGCVTKAQCPQYFDCVFPPSGMSHCERLACSGDADCGSGGFCVDGACYAALGSCRVPPP